MHMRRAKYIPNGGPDGGDGGRGGHVILRGNRNYWTLLHLRYERHAFATHGENGSRNKSFGKTAPIKSLKYLVEQWLTMPKQVSISATSLSMDRNLSC